MRKALSLGAAPSAKGGSEGTVAPAKPGLRGVKSRPVLSSCVWLSRGSNRVLRPWSPWSPTRPTAVHEMLTDITGGTQWRTRADGVAGSRCPDSPWGCSGRGVTGTPARVRVSLDGTGLRRGPVRSGGTCRRAFRRRKQPKKSHGKFWVFRGRRSRRHSWIRVQGVGRPSTRL